MDLKETLKRIENRLLEIDDAKKWCITCGNYNDARFIESVYAKPLRIEIYNLKETLRV